MKLQLTEKQKDEIMTEIVRYVYDDLLYSSPGFLVKLWIAHEIRKRFIKEIHRLKAQQICATKGHQWIELDASEKESWGKDCHVCKRCGVYDLWY